MSALMLLSAAQAFYYVCSTRFIYPKFVDSSAAAVPIDPVIPVIFNSTIAVSLALLTQIICEVLALFSNSLVLWKVNLWLLLALVSVIIPFTLIQTLLPAKKRLSMGLFAVYLFLFWRLGAFSRNRPGSLLTAVANRAGIIGVTLMAAVSGYGSVLTPMKLFAPALRSIPADSSSYNVVLEEGLHEYQKRCFHATAQLQQARRRQQTSRPGDAGSRSSSWLSWIPILGGDAEAEELADLEMAVEAMNDEYERRKYEQEQALYMKTPVGRLWVAFNHMLAVYAVYRVFASVVNVLRGRAGDADPVTVACGILVHVFADWDVRLWAKEISFLFVGSLIVSSGRSFFQEVLKVAKVQKGNAPSMLLSAALLCGLFVTSTVLMLRLNLPPQARPLISQVLVGMEFDFFERCFDFMYLTAAVITGLYIYMTRM